MPLCRNSVETYRPQSSQFAEPLWIDPSVKSGISVREPISTYKKKKKRRKRRQRMNGRTFSQSPRKRGKRLHNMYLSVL